MISKLGLKVNRHRSAETTVTELVEEGATLICGRGVPSVAELRRGRRVRGIAGRRSPRLQRERVLAEHAGSDGTIGERDFEDIGPELRQLV